MDGMIETQIRERAYAIWEQEGRPAGREYDHWVRAAGEVSAPAIKTARTPEKPDRAPRRSLLGRTRSRKS